MNTVLVFTNTRRIPPIWWKQNGNGYIALQRLIQPQVGITVINHQPLYRSCLPIFFQPKDKTGRMINKAIGSAVRKAFDLAQQRQVPIILEGPEWLTGHFLDQSGQNYYLVN